MVLKHEQIFFSLAERFSCIVLIIYFYLHLVQAEIYLFKVHIGNARAMCETCSKLTIKTLGRRNWRRFNVFIVNFEQISHIVLVFSMLTLNKKMSTCIKHQIKWNILLKLLNRYLTKDERLSEKGCKVFIKNNWNRLQLE